MEDPKVSGIERLLRGPGPEKLAELRAAEAKRQLTEAKRWEALSPEQREEELARKRSHEKYEHWRRIEERERRVRGLGERETPPNPSFYSEEGQLQFFSWLFAVAVVFGTALSLLGQGWVVWTGCFFVYIFSVCWFQDRISETEWKEKELKEVILCAQILSLLATEKGSPLTELEALNAVAGTKFHFNKYQVVEALKLSR